MEDRISVLEAKYESLEKMFEVALNTAQSQTESFVLLVGIIVPIVGILVGTLAIKYFVKDAVEKSLEENLIKLYERNPPTFNYSGNFYLSERCSIELDESIKGIDQLTEKTLEKLEMYSVDPTVKRERVLGVIKHDEKTKLPFVQLLVPEDLIGKLIYVNLTWKRTKIEKNF